MTFHELFTKLLIGSQVKNFSGRSSSDICWRPILDVSLLTAQIKFSSYSMYIVIAYITKFTFTRKCIWHVNCKVIPFDKYITFDKYSIKIIM